jgi:hypothetical protein
MTDVTSDRMLAYLVSIVIIMAGAIWSEHSAASALYLAIGIPTLVVGFVSLFAEWRN